MRIRRGNLRRRALGVEGEGLATVGGKLADNGEEGLAGVREGGLGAVDEPEAALDFELRNGDLDEFAALEFGLDGETGDEGDAVAEGDEALDGFEAGEFDAHVEGSLVASEGFDDALAEGGGDDVGDKVLLTEFADGEAFASGERMAGGDDEGHRVGIDGDGVEAVAFGAEGEDAEFSGALQKLLGDGAGEGALDHDVDVGMNAPEGVEDGEEPEAGVLVGGDGEASAFEGAEFFEGGGGFGAQAEEAFGVGAEELAGGGEGAFAGGALKEGFADLFFQLADGVADGGLGAVHAGGGAGEAAFFGYGEKGFELIEVHGRGRVSPELRIHE